MNGQLDQKYSLTFIKDNSRYVGSRASIEQIVLTIHDHVCRISSFKRLEYEKIKPNMMYDEKRVAYFTTPGTTCKIID